MVTSPGPFFRWYADRSSSLGHQICRGRLLRSGTHATDERNTRDDARMSNSHEVSTKTVVRENNFKGPRTNSNRRTTTRCHQNGERKHRARANTRVLTNETAHAIHHGTKIIHLPVTGRGRGSGTSKNVWLVIAIARTISVVGRAPAITKPILNTVLVWFMICQTNFSTIRKLFIIQTFA